MLYDIIIIGGGPAGLNAAIYACRAGLKVGIVEKDAPGGKMVKTEKIENYIGVPAVSGAELGLKMFNQATSFGAEYLYGDVQKIEKEENFKVICDSDTYESKRIIVATGTSERKLGIPGEDKFYGRGISYCAVCDGALYKDQDMAVIGGGNSALQEALYLSRFAHKIYLIHRRDEFRGEEILTKRIEKTPNIELVLNSVPLSINGKTKVSEIVVQNVLNKEQRILEVAVVFPFIGFDPATKFLPNEILDKQGYIKVDKNYETSIKGLYAAGDCIPKDLRQVITAANDGAIAATKVAQSLEK